MSVSLNAAPMAEAYAAIEAQQAQPQAEQQPQQQASLSQHPVSEGAQTVAAVYSATADATFSSISASMSAGSEPIPVYKKVGEGRDGYVRVPSLDGRDFKEDGSWSSSDGIIPGYNPSGWYTPASRPIEEVLWFQLQKQGKQVDVDTFKWLVEGMKSGPQYKGRRSHIDI
jgi:hypothetical protein